MKKLVIVILAMFSLMLLISCSKEQTCTVSEKDGVKTYRNKNIPTVEKLDFNPVKKFTLNADSNDVNYLSYIDLDFTGVDNEQNIYIADGGASPKVNKYDKNGNFITRFVNQGLGPGEVNRITYLCVKNDTVYVGDDNQSVLMFNTSGEFLNKIRPEGYRFQVRPLGTNKFLCAFLREELVENKILLTKELTIMNNSFEPLKILNQMKFLGEEMSVPDVIDWVSSTKDKIYVGVNDKMFYKINVFDHNGNLIEEIYKNYSAITFTEEEYEKMTAFLKRAEQASLNRNLVNKKRSVVGVYTDKNGNLIIQPAVDTSKGNTDGIVLDFFKENTYLNTYLLKTEKPYYQCDFGIFLSFYNDKMFKIDSENCTIEVYEY